MVRRHAWRTRANWGALALALAALTLAPGPAPAPASAPPTTPTPAHGTAPPSRTVSAWLPWWDQRAAYDNALSHAAQLRTISPFWYEAKGADRIDGHPGAGERRIIAGLHGAGIQVVPTVMEQLRPGALAAVLARADSRATHIRALERLVLSRAYDGIDLDYESIAPTGDAAYQKVRADYATFVAGLCRRLHELHKQCFVTVSPQTANTGRVWDYRRLGAAADRLRIMGYDLHWSGGPSGPLSSPDWYDDILRRATAQVPVRKLEMGLPAYGWDWAADTVGHARHVTSKEAEALRRRVKAPYSLDPISRTPHFTYEENGTRRTVWYQDARGIAEDLPVLRKYGVTSTVLWALNFEDPQLWRTLA